MLIEDLYTTEKLELTQEQNMTNKVNIQFLRDQLDKALADVEDLKDKVRQNGNKSLAQLWLFVCLLQVN